MEQLNKLWAKSSGETIREHTDKLLEAFEFFKRLYGRFFDDKTLKAIEYACEYHDYGKASYVFQRLVGNRSYTDSLPNRKELEKLYREIGFEKNLPHGYLSPAFINYGALKRELDEESAECVVNAIYHHHNRDKDISVTELRSIIEAEFSPMFGAAAFKYRGKIFSELINESEWIRYAIILGMLNKFDYYASDTREKFPVEISGEYNNKFISDYVYESITQNYELRDVQKYMLENRESNLIITASTGIGKTEAALLWAGNRKLFYTLPLKVSINAMYRRIKNNYGYSSDKVTLLHSDALAELMNSTDDESYMLKYQASRRFSYPITVCTIDQLFSFVYKYRGCELLLASLKYAVLVIDEIQSYEPKLIARLIYGLKLITEAGGKFAIITATLPPVLMYFIDNPDFNIPHLPPREFLITDKIRHKISFEESDDFNYDEISTLGKSKKVLVICNTVKRAVAVYKRLREYSSEVRLLHSKFMKLHRKMLEDEIMRFAEAENECGIWVSTQIVEASLDIDFDMLFTEMCTADGLLQRMGRCYRKRSYDGAAPNISIINNKSGYGTVYRHKDIFDRSCRFLSEFNNSLFSEQDKISYINRVYDAAELKNSKSGYFEEIKEELNYRSHTMPFEFTKETAKQKFRDIISYMIIPESEFNKQNDKFTEYCDILRNPKKHRYADIIEARRFIEEHSISLGTYDPRSYEKSNSLFSGLDYYTLNYKYNFDESTLCGTGLEYYTDEGSCFI